MAWRESAPPAPICQARTMLPVALVFTMFAIVNFSALDPTVSRGERAKQCALALRGFAGAVALIDVQLALYGYWKGIWELFGSMMVIASLDLALVFLVFRYLDIEQPNGASETTASRRPGG